MLHISSVGFRSWNFSRPANIFDCWSPVALGLAALLLSTATVAAQRASDDRPCLDAGQPSADDLATPVAALQKRLASGTATLEFEPGRGYLLSLLRWLNVPVSSQTLVFSKTSLQHDLISPQTPRALYFNDEVYVAWVPQSEVIEVSDVHPTVGPRFYTLRQQRQSHPTFTPREDCIRCHDGLKTLGGPGYLMGSNFTAPDGRPLFAVDRYMGGHRSPLHVRWGGWYVTGTHAGDLHLGNAFLTDKTQPEMIDRTAGANLTDLRGKFDTSRYASPHSDIVALLVLEHQIRMHNLISRVHREARDACDEQATRPPGPNGTPTVATTSTRPRIAHAAEALLEYMLFRDEAPLKGRIQGTSAFAAEFERGGPHDSQGRSLCQLDLNRRLLRFPCSFLVYSAAFEAFPPEVKDYLWHRLSEILSGRDQTTTYASMTPADRQAVLDILRETKPEFAAWLRVH